MMTEECLAAIFDGNVTVACCDPGANETGCNDLIKYSFIGGIATISLLIFLVAVLVAVAVGLGIKVKKLKR